MTEKKRFELKLCSNGTYYVYENGTLTDIDFDKFNKESADALIDEVNALYDENEELKDALNQRTEQCNKYYKENEQLKHDATVLIYSNQEYRKENEQLKQENQELHKLNQEYIDSLSDEKKETLSKMLNAILGDDEE